MKLKNQNFYSLSLEHCSCLTIACGCVRLACASYPLAIIALARAMMVDVLAWHLLSTCMICSSESWILCLCSSVSRHVQYLQPNLSCLLYANNRHWLCKYWQLRMHLEGETAIQSDSCKEILPPKFIPKYHLSHSWVACIVITDETTVKSINDL